VRRAVEGLTVPIRDILKVEYGPVFEPEEVASLTAAFDAALSKLGLVDREEPMTTTVAKLGRGLINRRCPHRGSFTLRRRRL